METLKSILISIIILAILGSLGYWAISTIQSGTEFETSQKIKKFQKENDELREQLKDTAKELDEIKLKIKEIEVKTKEPEPTPKTEVKTVATPSTPTKVVYKYEILINELQKIVDSNLLIKIKSTGAQVGSLQKFLNIYNKTSSKVDNDFGSSTEKLIIAFQKDQGLKADGEVGSSTVKKMIEWLKKQK